MMIEKKEMDLIDQDHKLILRKDHKKSDDAEYEPSKQIKSKKERFKSRNKGKPNDKNIEKEESNGLKIIGGKNSKES